MTILVSLTFVVLIILCVRQMSHSSVTRKQLKLASRLRRDGVRERFEGINWKWESLTGKKES